VKDALLVNLAGERTHCDVVSGRLMTGTLGYYVRVEGSGPVVLLLHGFTGSHKSWDAVAPKLAQHYTVVRPDLPGHAGSVVGKNQVWSMDTVVFSLFRLMRELGFPKSSCVGYSMGGRLALSMAARAPERLECLVLESASPGLRTTAERDERTAADEQLAQRIEKIGLHAFVKEWASKPLFATQARLPRGIQEQQRHIRLSHLPSGLSASLRRMGTGVQPPVWNCLAEMTMPTLILTGEVDSKFAGIGREMSAVLPDANHQVIPHAGHAVHLEQPEEYDQVLTSFLAQHAKLPTEFHGWMRGVMFADEEEQ
jgi:2-succinyl-6-hydroxy-2,4-cyclohexadiene-1-carboxylate synthase